MFFKKLYYYSKPAFFGLIGFLAAFAFLNYKWGMVAAPIYQFGMYSEPMHTADTQTVYQIYINNKPVSLAQSTFTEQDILLISLENYQKSFQVNESVYLTMNRILSKAGVGKLMNREFYVSDTAHTQFNDWYKKLLQEKMGYPVRNAMVTRSRFIYEGTGFKQISQPENLISFGTQ